MIDKIEATQKNLKNFGVMFGIILAVVAALGLYVGWEVWMWIGVGSLFFFVTAFVGQRVLKPVYIGWMMFALALAWVNTRILLGVFFYLVLTPIGFILRLSGKDLLNEKIEMDATSYWVRREKNPFDPNRTEKMF